MTVPAVAATIARMEPTFTHPDMGGLTPDEFADLLEAEESDDAWGPPIVAEICLEPVHDEPTS